MNQLQEAALIVSRAEDELEQAKKRLVEAQVYATSVVEPIVTALHERTFGTDTLVCSFEKVDLGVKVTQRHNPPAPFDTIFGYSLFCDVTAPVIPTEIWEADDSLAAAISYAADFIEPKLKRQREEWEIAEKARLEEMYLKSLQNIDAFENRYAEVARPAFPTGRYVKE